MPYRHAQDYEDEYEYDGYGDDGRVGYRGRGGGGRVGAPRGVAESVGSEVALYMGLNVMAVSMAMPRGAPAVARMVMVLLGMLVIAFGMQRHWLPQRAQPRRLRQLNQMTSVHLTAQGTKAAVKKVLLEGRLTFMPGESEKVVTVHSTNPYAAWHDKTLNMQHELRAASQCIPNELDILFR